MNQYSNIEGEQPYAHHQPVSDQGEDSFFAGSVKSQEQQPQQEEQPQEEATKKHKSRPKKKHINKKRGQKPPKPPKKTHTTKQQQKQIRLYQMGEKKAHQIMHEMNKRYEKDLVLQQQKKLACKKLSFVEDLSKHLKNIYVCDKFIEHNGMALFQKWMDKVQIGQDAIEPGVSLRKGVMEILLSLHVNPQNISKTNDIQRLVARQKRSQVKELRQLSQQIILKWNKIAYEAQ